MLLLLSLVLAQAPSTDLSLVSLEDLMKIEVTSASRREQRADSVPAAVYVIGRDEIRRSGMTAIPDLLRLVPGVQVAQINSNKWAVSVRGFNSLYSNKLLVMVDGRSIYNPAFSTVLWDTEDLMIEDIDRIEVIRGPGGSMWGANAVNGVINIISRHSAETRGGFVRATAGWDDASDVGVRYGGLLGRVSYRVYAQGTAHEDSRLEGNQPANDRWRSVTGGFRSDWSNAANRVMVQGSASFGRQHPLWMDFNTRETLRTNTSDTGVSNIVGRWTRTGRRRSELQLQAYYDRAHRAEAIATYDRHTVDVDAQYHVALGANTIVTGGGYRFITEAMEGVGAYRFTPGHLRPHIVNAFAQDAIAFAAERGELTIGGKFESNSFAGSGFQPTARVMWQLDRRQRLWAAASHALRTPSLIDRGLQLQYQPELQADGSTLAVGVIGNPAFESERLTDIEAGYRLTAGNVASLDLTGFAAGYDKLATLEQLAPSITLVDARPVANLVYQYDNRLAATTRGVEIAARVRIAAPIEVDGAFTYFSATPSAPESRDWRAIGFDGNAPTFQWRVHSALSLGTFGQADAHVFRVGELKLIEVPAYTRVDLRWELRPVPPLSIIINGENLAITDHLEFDGRDTNIQRTWMPRRANVQFAWRF